MRHFLPARTCGEQKTCAGRLANCRRGGLDRRQPGVFVEEVAKIQQIDVVAFPVIEGLNLRSSRKDCAPQGDLPQRGFE